MEVPLRAALIAWLSADPTLASQLNAVVEEAPARTSPPFLALAASASSDWSTKTESGREVQVTFALQARGDVPGSAGDLVAAIEARIAALPRAQAGFTVVSSRFLRARAEQQAESRRLVTLEYLFRLLATMGDPA
jgi:hypothetical protein